MLGVENMNKSKYLMLVCVLNLLCKSIGNQYALWANKILEVSSYDVFLAKNEQKMREKLCLKLWNFALHKTRK